jgi:hypothetical protein
VRDVSWPYREIGEQAERQQGQVGRAQLRGLGVGPGAIAYALHCGRITETFRNVFTPGDLALPPLWREMGAALTCGTEAFVSRRSALVAWGAYARSDELIDVTVPYRLNPVRAGVRLHRAKKIDPNDVTELEGVPIATPAFALLEIATDVTFEELERAFDDALTKQVMTVAEARDTLERHAGRPGCKRFEELAKPDHALQITRSWLEQRMKSLIGKGGLPLPVVNVRKGRILPDFEWHTEMVIVEVDGYRTHGTRRAFESDRARDAQLAANGWIVLRFTWRQLKYEPAVVLVRLAQTLAIRRQRAA